MIDWKPTVAITMGDPAGIGAEIIVKAYPTLREVANPVVIGDVGVMRAALDVVDSDLGIERIETVERNGIAEGDIHDERDGRDGRDVRANLTWSPETNPTYGPEHIPVVDLGLVENPVYGEIREEYGEASLAYIEEAIRLAVNGTVDAIATAPINKQATRLAGSEYAGHTGMLADYTDTDNYSMLLVEEPLRVTHVSTHVPLQDACELVTTENVLETIRVTERGLCDLGIEDPTIAVAGLNPHAGDGGLLGDRDEAEIEPAVAAAREEGINVFGPESPDTVFVQAAGGAADCVVAMYHDQGHIPVKMLGFTDGGAVSGVNVTLGLPIVRTSVDHGTAFDIAGQGIASNASLVDAVELAAQIARRRTERERADQGTGDP